MNSDGVLSRLIIIFKNPLSKNSPKLPIKNRTVFNFQDSLSINGSISNGRYLAALQ